MLFNSHVFLFIFLPLCLGGFELLGRCGWKRGAIAWLVGMSLAFYAWWHPPHLWILVFSILFNYGVARLQARAVEARQEPRATGSKPLLALGIIVNLGLLGWFKYANFVVDNATALAGSDFVLGTIVLPLAISFFTFQQVAYLVDSYHGSTRGHSFLDYALFVSFFPQLIAGPIVHHREVLPQFARSDCRLKGEHLAPGLTLLAVGLFKKVIIADTLARAASPVYTAAEGELALTFFEAWGGVLAFTGQLYFDFSGYSDMATGLARCFGITLPMNFNSPYKSRSMIEFWTRWHITLSRFLRDYLFFPLCGKRPTYGRRLWASFWTMVLGGIWHGAGWTFVLWGVLHGAYMVVNHAWRDLAHNRTWPTPGPGLSFAYGVLTFLAVVVSLVFFRAESLWGVGRLFVGMSGWNGLVLPRGMEPALFWLEHLGIGFAKQAGAFPTQGFSQVAVALGLAFLAPNSLQILRGCKPVLERIPAAPTTWPAWRARWGWQGFLLVLPAFRLLDTIHWRRTIVWGLITAAVAGYALSQLTTLSEFLYFDF